MKERTQIFPPFEIPKFIRSRDKYDILAYVQESRLLLFYTPNTLKNEVPKKHF